MFQINVVDLIWIIIKIIIIYFSGHGEFILSQNIENCKISSKQQEETDNPIFICVLKQDKINKLATEF